VPTVADAPQEPLRRPAFVITPTADLQETFTDNALLVHSGARSDFISTVTGGVDVAGKTNRTQIAGSYSVSGDFYARNSSLNGYRQNLLTLDRFEPLKDKFSIDLRGALDQQQIALTGVQSATPRSGVSNQTQVANFSITPTYTERWGGWAVSTLSYSLNRVDYFTTSTGSTANNLNGSTQQTLLAALNSGSDFTRLTWSLALSDNTSRGSQTHLTEQTAVANAEYRVVSAVRVPVEVGYDNFSQIQSGFSSAALSGVFWSAGIHLVPGPRTDLTLRYGERYGESYESGLLTYKVLPNVQLISSYDVAVQTQQQALAASLQGLTMDSRGNIINPISGLPTSPNQLNTNLVNNISRSRTFRFGISGTHGLNFFSLAGQSVIRSYGSAQPGDRSQGITVLASRKLSPAATLSVGVQAYHTEVSGGTSSTSVLTNLDLTRQLSERTDLSFDVTRRQQNGINGADEDAAVIRISRKF
jgi:uncharacterized protein (PEP-CTERM system associated)